MRICLIIVTAGLAACSANSGPRPETRQAPAAATQRFLRQSTERSRLLFEPDGERRFLGRGDGFTVALEKDGMTIASGGRRTRFVFAGASPAVKMEGLEPGRATVNYFLGNDPEKWKANVPTYGRVGYRDLYPGIDLVYYGEKQNRLEYDLIVAPGADPGRIRFKVSGDGQPELDRDGDLHLDGSSGHISLERPVLYQNVSRGKRIIAGALVQLAKNEFGFKPAAYDRSRPLVIDPAINLVYSTYLGGVHDDQAHGIVLDAQGNAYIIGESGSEDFPVSGNAYQPVRKHIGTYVRNVVVTKFDASGTILFSTFLGGSTSDYGNAITLDVQGNVYVAGYSASSDFPVTANAFQGSFAGSQQAFLAVLSPDGSALNYSSYFGGMGGSKASALSFSGKGLLYVSGTAGPGLPTTAGAYKTELATANAAFVAIFNGKDGVPSQLVASTYYGTDNPVPNNSIIGNQGLAMVVDSGGNPWIGGNAFTNNLPTTPDSFQPMLSAINANCQGAGVPLNSAAYYAHLSADLSKLLYASYYSGQMVGPNVNACSEYIYRMALDASDNLYVAGLTASTTFPVTPGVIQDSYPGGGGFYGFVQFLAKFGPDGKKPLWSTYFGGDRGDTFPQALVLDGQQNLWLAGDTAGGTNFPITADGLKTTVDGPNDGYVTELRNDGSKVLYSTYLGGSDSDSSQALTLDPQGNVYVAGYTNSKNFQATQDAFQGTLAPHKYDGNNITFTILGSGTIGAVNPAVGGNTGDTTIVLRGAGLHAGASCSLSHGGVTITAIAVTTNAGGTSMTCTFPLTGAAPGAYDIMVKNQDGSAFARRNGFMVQSGGQPQVWADMIGRPKIRTGVPATHYVTFGNSGSVDAYFTVLTVALSSSLSYTFPNGITPGANPKGIDFQAVDSIQDVNSGLTYIGFLIPLLPAGSSREIPVQIVSSQDQTFLVAASVDRPWFDSLSSAQHELSSLSLNPASLPGDCQLNGQKPYLENCLGPWTNYVARAAGYSSELGSPSEEPTQPTQEPNNQIQYRSQFLAGLQQLLQGIVENSGKNAVNLPTLRGLGDHIVIGLQASALYLYLLDKDLPIESSAGIMRAKEPWMPAGDDDSCVLDLTHCGPPQLKEDHGCIGPIRIIDYVRRCQGETKIGHQYCEGEDNYSVFYDCDMKMRLWPPPIGPCHQRNTPRQSVLVSALSGSCGSGSSGGSIDPNFKVGSQGDYSSGHYGNGTTPLQYVIGFENEPTATLPAAQVVVIDQLDPDKLDLSTLKLGTIAFGSNVINPPVGTNNYNTIYSLNSSLSVRIQGSLNPATGLLKWTFTSIDPTTNQPPSDPTVGFLPPDKDGIIGQGSVLLTVMPKAGQPTGTKITNQATVVFDSNPPIKTPTWLNTLDIDPPSSKVSPLPATTPGTSFSASWSGTDNGAGIASYTIYVSDNGGPFTPWQIGTTATSATFTGQDGHSYGFYSIATDGAGNVEVAKSQAEASIAVGQSAGCSCSIGGRRPPLPLGLAVLLLAAVLVVRRRRA